MEFGIRREIYEKIIGIVQKYDYKFVVFGSRARGDYRHNSDIDIAVFGEILAEDEMKIKNEFDLIDMEYMVDIVFVSKISSKELLKSIEREGVTIKWKDMKKEEKI